MANPNSGYVRPIFQVEWSLNYVWNTGTLIWEPMTQPAAGGGGMTDAQFTAHLPLPVSGLLTANIQDSAGNPIVSASAAQSGGLAGLVVRPVLQCATSTKSNVVSAAADTSLLASNGFRMGATIYNDADKDLLVSLGTTAASASSFTVKVVPGAYYEVPFGYIGAVRGIWGAAPTGSARVCEMT